MTYGLIIRNKNNNIVISDETVAIQQIREGVLKYSGNKISGPPSMSDSCIFILPSTISRNSILFFSPVAGQYVTAQVSRDSGGLVTWAVLSNWTNDIPYFECAPATDITNLPKASWGLEIRAPNGDIRFHSGAPLVAMDDHYEVDMRSVGSGYYDRGWTREVTVGANAWVCPLAGGGRLNELISNYPPSRRHVTFKWATARLSGSRIGLMPLVSSPVTTSESTAISHAISNMSFFTA